MKIYSGLRGQELLFDSGKLKPIFFFDEDSEVYFNDCKYLNSLENLPKIGLVSLVNCGEFRENSCPIKVTRFLAEACQHLKSVKNVTIYKQKKHIGYDNRNYHGIGGTVLYYCIKCCNIYFNKKEVQCGS